MATILHVDMDAFFASVEQLHHPEWRGRPLIVGAGPRERGVVSTCSYEARRFGVHSAMPSRTAYERCPQAIFTRPHMELYAEASEKAFAVFGSFTPFVEGVSIDEAFLDITGSIHLHGSAERLGEALRERVRKECGVTCSVGIAPNRLLAKIGSEQRKPDGLTIMPFDADEIARFLRDRPIGILWGVGRKTEAALAPYGIRTCGDVQRLTVAQLTKLLGSAAYAETLYGYSFGRDSSSVAWEREAEKSVSREHTFDRDESNPAKIRGKLLELVAEVGRRFRRERRWATTARLKLRDAAFNTVTRQMKFTHPSRDDISFRAAALELLSNERLPAMVRLIGFGVTGIVLSPEDAEPSLFPDPDEGRRRRNERLSEALDALRDRGLIG